MSYAFQDFLRSEYRGRDFESYRQFADWLEVDVATISKAMSDTAEYRPGIEFMAKIHRKTGVAFSDIVELAYPGLLARPDATLSSRILAQQIEQLDEPLRETVAAVIRGAVKRRDSE